MQGVFTRGTHFSAVDRRKYLLHPPLFVQLIEAGQAESVEEELIDKLMIEPCSVASCLVANGCTVQHILDTGDHRLD
jgi:hypothetical protein